MEPMKIRSEIWKKGMYGLMVGDTLGVPGEFQSREALALHPITRMVPSVKSHGKPAGTWSDDSSMALATADSLIQNMDQGREADLRDIMEKFRDWLEDGAYTADGDVFDCGLSCSNAIRKYERDPEADPRSCGGTREDENGNGSLMRILPACLYAYERMKGAGGAEVPRGESAVEGVSAAGGWSRAEALDFIADVSRLTHAHAISVLACQFYFEIVVGMLEGTEDLVDVVKRAAESSFQPGEPFVERFVSFMDVEAFRVLPESAIGSSGFVLDTIEAAVWCLLGTDSYEECVLRAVNLGRDADTTAAVAGGLAGLWYGIGGERGIPEEWIEAVVSRVSEVRSREVLKLLEDGPGGRGYRAI